ncbi:MAG: nuclease [Zetaproteobacteria bacterium CG_4_9_14_0_2_um_filter_59_191]|nr:MAG: nuclease [Zetaproteobacteria bacterium CG_4_9_14_0_2_um_filter_59_191]
MGHDWRRKKARFNVPSDTVMGAGVLGGIALIVALLILGKGRDEAPSEMPASTQTVRVIDGDTIEVNHEKVRLYGIDAPEMGQPCTRNNSPYDCGRASKEHLEFVLTGATVNCRKKGKDKWGRFVAECTADGEDISHMMVRHGWALAYREYSTAYVSDEEFATSNKLGMWSKEFSIPSEWRKSNRGDKL